MIESLTWSSVGAALIAPIVALGTYAYWVLEKGVIVRKTIVSFLLGVAASGMAAGFLGMYVGAFVMCALVEENNCGVGGSLVGTPVGFALGIALFRYFWVRLRQN